MDDQGPRPTPLSERLRALREAVGWSQEVFANRAGISTRTVSDIELGISRSPQRATVNRLANGLSLTGAERAAFLELLPKRIHRKRSRPDRQPTDPAPRCEHGALDLPTQSRLRVTSGPLIGRDPELAAAAAALSGAERLMTITGPPGVGKTRFALELARQPSVRDVVDATAFVSLAPVRTRAEAVGLITTTLGISGTGGAVTLTILREFLQRHRILLVLDNLEQIDEVASLIAKLQGSGTRSRILATSRHRLSLRRGREVALPPLALPEPQRVAPMALDELRRTDSVAFLLDRLQRNGSPIALTPGNVPVLAELCLAVDGLPLALEIVAARLRSMAPDHLLAQLRERKSLSLLGPEDAPDRQRSLRSAIAWSVDLLAPDSRRMLAAVAVCAGGFTAEAAFEVVRANSEPPDTASVPELLGDLVDQHLLVLEHSPSPGDQPDGTTVRYRLLETIRDYGLELLASGATGVNERSLRDAHARWCAGLVDIAEWAQTGNHPERWLWRLDLELANIRAALDWSSARGRAGDAELAALGLRLSARLWHYWRVRGLSEEGIRRIETALDVDTDRTGAAPGLDRAIALNNLGTLVMDTGDSLRTQSLYETSLAMSRAIGDGRGVADTVNNLGVLAVYHGDYVGAQRYHEESWWLRQPLGDPQRMIVSMQNLGDLALDLALSDLAITFHAEGLQIAQRVGDRASAAYGYQSMGEVLTDLGHLGRARRYLTDALAIFEATGDQLGLGFLAHTWGWLSDREGNHPAALAWQQRALGHWRRANNRRGQVNAIEAAALALCQLNRSATAAVLLGNAQRVRDAEHVGRPPKRTPQVERAIASLEGDGTVSLGASNADLPLDELVSMALGLDAIIRPRHVPRRNPSQPGRTVARMPRHRPRGHRQE